MKRLSGLLAVFWVAALALAASVPAGPAAIPAPGPVQFIEFYSPI